MKKTLPNKPWIISYAPPGRPGAETWCLSHQFFWGNICAIQKHGLIVVDGKTRGVQRLNMFYSCFFLKMFLKQRHIWWHVDMLTCCSGMQQNEDLSRHDHWRHFSTETLCPCNDDWCFTQYEDWRCCARFAKWDLARLSSKAKTQWKFWVGTPFLAPKSTILKSWFLHASKILLKNVTLLLFTGQLPPCFFGLGSNQVSPWTRSRLSWASKKRLPP